MAFVEVPCGKENLRFALPDENLLGVIEPHACPEAPDESMAVAEALAHPVGAAPLKERVRQGQTVAIVATDSSRYASEQLVVPALLKALSEAGIPDRDITLVVATGTHDPNDREECVRMYGREVVDRIRIENHRAFDEEGLVALGKTKTQGIPVVVNKTVAAADVRISTGVIEPHLLAGYSGGGKSLSVGVAGAKTIRATHNVAMFEHPRARLGVTEGNIFREFLEEAAGFVRLDFIVNVVLNSRKRILKAFAGDPVQAHRAGVDFARNVYEVPVSREADIVIASAGYPKDKNLYQGTRAFNTCLFGPKPILREGGIVIIPMECGDGLGDLEGRSFHHYLKAFSSPKEAYRHIVAEGFEMGEQKAYFLSKGLSWAEVFSVGCRIPDQTLKDLFITPFRGIDEAVSEAFRRLGSRSRVWVMPHAIITIPVLESAG